MTGRRRILVILGCWAAAMVGLVLLVKNEHGELQDVRILELNTCGVDTLTPFAAGDNPSAVELDFVQHATGLLSLFNSTVTTGGDTRTIYGTGDSWFNGDGELDPPAHSPGMDVEAGLTSPTGQFRSMRYEVRALPRLHSAVVDLVVVPRVRARELGTSLAATFTGFDAKVTDDTPVRGDGTTVSTPRERVLLTNGRCSLLVWGPGLSSYTVMRRKIGFGVDDFMFRESLTPDGRGRLYLTFLYGKPAGDNSTTLLRHVRQAADAGLASESS